MKVSSNDLLIQLNPEDRVPKMAEDVSPDHLKLFPLHDDVLTRTVEIDDEYRLKMMYHLQWLQQKATMFVSCAFPFFEFNCLILVQLSSVR